MSTVLDVVSAVLLLLGVGLVLLASLGLVRFTDVLARMHAATKASSTGLMLVLVATALQLPGRYAALLLLVGVFQLLTAPVAAHMVGRAAYRAGAHRPDLIEVDERPGA